MDFTPAIYTRLLDALQASDYAFQTIAGFFESPGYKTVLLRHDVDLLPKNALAMAKLEHELGVVSTYYFRAVPGSWDEGVIREIASLGHEVGYHYECLATASIAQRRPGETKEMRSHGAGRGAEKEKTDVGCRMSEVGGQRAEVRRLRVEETKGNRDRRTKQEKLFELAYEDFKRNLERLRKLVPISTVCMHGSPLLGIDNLDLLKRYDYKSLGLVAEPYLDVDFDQMFYLTDTGRRWDGEKVSVRDKVGGQRSEVGGKRQRSEDGCQRAPRLNTPMNHPLE